jgi:hypothetical protein
LLLRLYTAVSRLDSVTRPCLMKWRRSWIEVLNRRCNRNLLVHRLDTWLGRISLDVGD